MIHDKDKDRTPEHEQQPEQQPPDPTAEHPNRERAAAAPPAPPAPDPTIPAVLFLLQQAKIQNRDLAPTVDHLTQQLMGAAKGQNGTAPGKAPKADQEHETALQQSSRFKGRS